MAPLFTLIFLGMLAISLCLRLWLGYRQIRHVVASRGRVPSQFAERISLDDHRKAADYTVAKTRLALLELGAATTLILLLTCGGLLQAISSGLLQFAGEHGLWYGLGLFAAVGTISFMVDLPFDLYRTFIIEARFGFNHQTLRLYLLDLAKQLLLTALIGAPLLLAVLWLMDGMGESWWLWVWAFWLGFNVLALLLYPTLIAPMFNRFTPLADDAVKTRVEHLLERCGFCSNGLFVMDGSKRSSHGNAYFTGFGRTRRIVFFDTLLERLQPAEVEAVLAHELGHYKLKHIAKRIALLASASLVLLWGLGYLMRRSWFFEGLGVADSGVAMALVLFVLVLPVFTFPLSPLASALSRRHEYEADAYAAQQSSARELAGALVKLYRDNASTLTPDPLHSLFYDSHPPASLRIARLVGMH